MDIPVNDGVTIFVGATMNRKSKACFPFFSIPTKETDLLDEARAHIIGLGVTCEEFIVPLPSGNEILFLFEADDLDTFLLSRKTMPDTLKDEVDAWSCTTALTPFPEGSLPPRKYFPNIPQRLALIADYPEYDRARPVGKYTILNVMTGERGILTLDYPQKAYSVDVDMSDWLYFETLPL